MKLIQTVAPTSNCVTLVEMKNFLRVLHANDDDMITSMILMAQQSAELVMNRQIMPCTYELYFDVMDSEMILPRPPFISLESFQTYDGNIWNDVADYELDDKSTPCSLDPTSWDIISPAKNGVKVVYRAGWADTTKVPESIKAWIKIQVSTYYENRESFVVGVSVSELPKSHVDSLIERYRICNV